MIEYDEHEVRHRGQSEEDPPLRVYREARPVPQPCPSCGRDDGAHDLLNLGCVARLGRVRPRQ